MSFDYQGYPEKYLLELCDKSDLNAGCTKWKYGCTENYSQGRLYRECARFPKWKSLYVYSEHGIEFDVVGQHEVDNDAEAMFVFSEGKLQNYKKVSDKPVYKVLHPFIWYRRAYGIEKDKRARGTIAFPAHSNAHNDSRFNIDAYIEKLQALPEEMQPVCVCMYVDDIWKGRHKPFMEKGIPVYTAGNARDVRFVDRYYEVLKHFRYSTSNLIGSYTFYSVEMGVPFSLLGDTPLFYNNDRSEWNHHTLEQEEAAKRLFDGIHLNINEQQNNFISSKLNLNEHLSCGEMHKILVQAYRKKGSVCRDLMKYASRAVRLFFKTAFNKLFKH